MSILNLPKILSAEQIRAADQHTINNEPIASIDLMERASRAFVDAIREEIASARKIAVVAGPGNNGGDGLAVARMLLQSSKQVSSYLITLGPKRSKDCEENLQRLQKLQEVQHLQAGVPMPDLNDYDLIIDAIFGSGLSRAVEGYPAAIIDQINASPAKVISIDTPSGLSSDHVQLSGKIVQADLAISFQRPKWSFLCKESGPYLKQWKSVDIGLDEAFIQSQDSQNYLLDSSIVHSLPTRAKYSHKGSYGHSLIIAGSKGMIGAALLAAKACKRSGTGLLTVYVPTVGYTIVQSQLPEALCLTDPNGSHITELPDLSPYNAIAIGPGLGQDQQSARAFRQLLEQADMPLVIDADALNLLAKEPELLSLIPKGSILSPHPGEFRRLIGPSKDSMQQQEMQKAFAHKYDCILMLKGAHTSIADPSGNLYFNATGNPGMATGGSGDVLTGILTALLAQGITPLSTALLAVYHHGLAGDQAAKRLGQRALIASDIIENIRLG